jgi:hypothetical protein
MKFYLIGLNELDSMGSPMMIKVYILSLLGCSDSDGVTTEDYVPPEQLTLPDLSEVDVAASFEVVMERITEI